MPLPRHAACHVLSQQPLRCGAVPGLELHDGLLAIGFKQGWDGKPREGSRVFVVLGCDVNLIDPCTATVCWVLYGHALRP